ncbi:MAG: hypothetical protein JW767_11415, partial [Thermoleophilia bacterium]|nr:hypothetical protein [Thermoleophilia bacterium]
MQADLSPVHTTANAPARLWPPGIWGAALLVFLAFLLLVWLLLRWLTRRWHDEADRLAGDVAANVTVLQSDLTAVRDEATPYPREIEPPYHAPAQHLHTVLDAVGTALTIVNHGLVTLEAERSPAPLPLFSPALLWAALRDSYRQRAQLRLLLAQAADQRAGLDQARDLLRDLRRTPLDIAAQARALVEILDGADRVVAILRDRGVHGERLDTVQGAMQTQRAELAALPLYLLKAKESQIARLAQPAAITRAWQMLSHLDPAIREHAATLEGWLTACKALDHDLTTMRDAVASADDYIERVDPATDVSDLRTKWRLTRQAAEDFEARARRPEVEDLGDRVLAHDVTEEANALIARLASLEALRQSLVEKLSEDAGRLDELARQLRQLAEAGRYPLDRVPFQVELERLRRQLAAIGELSPN